MHSYDITIEGLSKIEGHADLQLKVRNDKVEDVKLMIVENRRFYEQAVQKMEFDTVPQLMSRICGTCSIAHEMCNIEAIERALEIIPSEQTMTLRNLAMYGLMIRDHGLHLGFFSLPDLLGKDSILDFDEKNKVENKLLHDIFDIKQAGNDLCTLVVGRAVHGIFPVVGGFSSIPDNEKAKEVIKKLKGIRGQTIDLIETFRKWNKSLNTPTEFASLVNSDFNFLNGSVLAAGKDIREENYIKHLKEFVIPYSTSKAYQLESKIFMVGALSRLNQNRKSLHKDTKKDVSLSTFPSHNIFHNNFSQAIEILHSIDTAVEILEETDFKNEDPVSNGKNTGEGVGVVEAPRGLLYHYVDIKKGKVMKAKVIVPTSQNQIKMERDIGMLVESLLPEKSKQEIEWNIEQLVRAYDPCMSCAAHFLKVKWK